MWVVAALHLWRAVSGIQSCGAFSRLKGKVVTRPFDRLAVPERSPFDAAELANDRRPRDTGWSIAEAYLAILICTQISRSDYHTVYRDSVIDLVSRSRALSSLSREEIAQANASVIFKLNKEEGFAPLATACSTLPRAMRLPVFAHCADIMLTEGQLVRPDADYLTQLAGWLELDESVTKRTVDVLALKARY